MDIPDEAVKAVALAIGGYDTATGDNQQEHEDAAREALGVAAPHIAAQALREAAAKILAHHPFPFEGDADFILALADEADNT